MDPSSPPPNYEPGLKGILKRSSHPIALIFHYLFKSLALISFIFLDLFIEDTIVTFIITLLLCCADFWTVQNITGRLLVALRWRNKVEEDGSEHWVYESLNEKYENNKIDVWGFWLGLYFYVALWILMLLGSLIQLSPFDIIEVLVCLGLAAVNLYGYTMCRKDYLQKISGAISVGTALGGFKAGADIKI